MPAPADGITDSVHRAEKHERRQRYINAQEHRENVGEPAAGVWPKPMRRQEFDCQPYADNDEKIFPRSRGFLLRPCCQCQRNAHETGDCGGTCQGESIRSEQVNQADQEDCHAEQVAAAVAEACGEATVHAARRKKQHHQKQKRESGERGSEGPASVAQPDGVQRCCQSQHGPESEHREQAELARGGQARIVTHGDGRPNSTTGVSAKLSAVRMSNNSLEIAVTPLCSMSMLRQFS